MNLWPRLRTVALLVLGNVLFFWQLRHPIVRFASPVVNEFLGLALGFCLPWLTGVAIFRVGRRWSTVIAALAIVPLLLYSAVILLGSAMTVGFKDGHDRSFDPFAETGWKGSVVRLYRIDGGATTDFGVVIRQERTLLPGVRLVRNLDSLYPCELLNAVSTDAGIMLTDERSGCRAFPEARREYRLKPFLYF